MKETPEILALLNERLSEELTAISFYMVHSEMSANWGYDKLHEAFEKQAIDEMKHAELLIGRILFLEGAPAVSKLQPMKVGATVEEMVVADEDAELGAIKAYNATIAAAVAHGGNGSASWSRRSCWTKSATSTGRRCSASSSSRWGCRTTSRPEGESRLAEGSEVRAARVGGRTTTSRPAPPGGTSRQDTQSHPASRREAA